MIEIIRGCQRIVQELRASLTTVRTKHVNREDIKEKVRGVVDGYFRTDRPILLHRLRNEELFVDIDRLMQELLRFSQHRTLTTRYKNTLKKLQQEWDHLEISSIPLFGDLTGGEIPQLTPAEIQIIETLERLCPSAAACYKQAFGDLNDESRISWRGTAAELREALREVLDTLASDAEVQKSPGFKLEKDARGPTMKQKVAFVLKSRRQSETARKTVEHAADVVEEKVGGFVRSVYNRSSVSVHAGRARDEVLSIKRFVDTVLIDLLEIRT